MIITLYILIAAWAVVALVAAIACCKYARSIPVTWPDEIVGRKPPAHVIVPFKGVDVGMQQSLDLLFNQRYKDYRLLLVVESEDDPACAMIRDAMARHPQRPAQLLVAGVAPPTVGQKVHNQLFALQHVETAGPGEALVFLDSDASPHDLWLDVLMYGLDRTPDVGAVTGYRWLVPEPGAGVWSQFASVINASVACIQGAARRNATAWGGSMVVSADLAREHDLEGFLRGALTDDYPVTRFCRAMGKRVYFPRLALVASPIKLTCGELFNFTYRQYVITRVYEPRLFHFAQGVTTAYVLGLIAAWVLLVIGLQRGDMTLWLAGAIALAWVFVCNQVRHAARRVLVKRLFNDETRARLRTAMRFDQWGTSVYMTLHALLVWRAQFGRTFVWRGIRYRLRGRNDVERLG